jgi:outer membrane lipoprotein-sorting protein
MLDMSRRWQIGPIVNSLAAFSMAYCVLIASKPSYSQPAPAVAEILRDVRSRYTGMSRYEFYATVSESLKGETSVHAIVQKPNRVRWEVTGPGAATFTGMYAGEEVIVSDAINVFWYRPKLMQYTKTPIGPLVTPMGTVAAFVDKIEDDLFYGFKFMDPRWAKLVRDESVPRNGSPVDCYVVEFDTPVPTTFTWWIDKKSNLVIRELFENARHGENPSVTRHSDFVFTSADEPTDDRSFVFVPPSGARQVDRFGQ